MSAGAKWGQVLALTQHGYSVENYQRLPALKAGYGPPNRFSHSYALSGR